MDLWGQIPLWGLFVLTAALVLLAIECGFRLGAALARGYKPEHDAPVGTVVQATLGLLAFMLAFTFGVAAERFNDRRVLIIEEANAIGTTYLRADFLPEKSKEEVQSVLREYLHLRVSGTGDRKLLAARLASSNRLQDKLWSQAAAIGRENLDSDVVALFVESLNETIDIQAKRVAAGLYARLPENVWTTLYFMTFLGMAALGYQSGSAGARSWPPIAVLTISFALVFTMIADLDRPREGSLNVSQQPLIDLSKKIGPPQTSPRRQESHAMPSGN